MLYRDRAELDEFTGLYGTFEGAADAVAGIAARGFEADVDVSYPFGPGEGPTIEVRLVGPLEDAGAEPPALAQLEERA